MSALGFVAGGLLEGAGAGILAEAKAQRDFMLKGIDQEFQGEQGRLTREHQTALQTQSEAAADRRQESQIEATHTEGEAGREVTRSEGKAGRELTASEGGLNRQQQTDIQAQNQDFLKTLPSNNPTETDPESGKIYTRTTNGLMPQNRPDGGQMAVPKLRVGASGKLYPAETTEDQAGEKLDAPQLKDDAIKIANERTSLEKTRLIVGGRQNVAETQAGAKKDTAQINADARMHIASASDDTKRLMIQTISDDKAKARDAQEKLKSMGIDAETANVAARGMSAAEVARINAGSREKVADIGAASREKVAEERTKAVSGKSSAFQFKYDKWLESNEGDTKGALDFASGRHTPADAQLRKWAQDETTKELSDDPANAKLKGPDLQAKRDEIFARYYSVLKGAKTPGVPAGPATPTPSPTPAAPTKASEAALAKPAGPDMDKAAGIKADMNAGKITKEQAMEQLKALGFDE